MSRLFVTRLFIIASLAVFGAACSDDDSCPSEVVVALSSPTNGQTITMDQGAAPGVQFDIRARSNLPAGVTFTLTVRTTGSTDAVATYEATSDSNGDVAFQSITLPAGNLNLEVSAAGDCGTGSDTITVTVLGDSECTLVIREGPIPNTFYNLPVLNTTNDSDGATANFQANIDITTLPGATAEVFILDLDGSATETSIGTVDADGTGVATFPTTLTQGRQAVRATCVTTGFGAASATHTVMVDTEAPTCSMTPTGTAIIPSMDEDGVTAGIQVTLSGTATGTDVEGEAASFTVGAQVITAPVLDASGATSAVGTFSSPSPPATNAVFSAQDHAGNTCTAGRDYTVDLMGCAITDVSTTLVTTDSDGTPGNGIQGEIRVNVDTDCAGQTATTTCDASGTATGTVPGDGMTTIPVTLCATSPCETVLNCETSVSDSSGNVTTAPVTIIVDNEAPAVSLQFVDPVTSCGSSVTAGDDIDVVTPGIQLDVRVVSPLADTRRVEVTNGATVTTAATAGGDARITVEPGTSNIVAVAEDQYANSANSGPCTISLADIAVTFTTPIEDGYVNASESTGSGGAVSFSLCGTTSETVDTVDVVIGVDTFPAVVTGTTWCAAVTLAESATPYTATANATITASGRTGLANALFTIDVTPPGAPTALAVITPTRESASMSWTAPADGGSAVSGYIVKYHTALLSEASFDGLGTVVTPPTPGSPGNTDSVLIESLQAGTSYWFAVAAVDPAGNRSAIDASGAIVPDFDQSGHFGVTNLEAAAFDGFGFSSTRGRFNNDAYWDLAISAPYQNGFDGRVYVFLGSATGINTSTPDYVIDGPFGGGAGFGTGITALRWDGDGQDDLAISAYLDDRVYIFSGTDFDGATTALGVAAADVVISPEVGSRYAGSGLGYSLATARFDNDAVDDLVMTTITSSGFTGSGGVTVLYGGTAGAAITLSDIGGGNAIAHYIPDPAGTADFSFGYWSFNLGRTEGAADGNDDIGIGVLCKASAWVLRGGSVKPASGDVVTRAYSAASDLEIRDDSGQESTCGPGSFTPYFGLSMGSISDVNGDGARDIVISSYKWNNTGAGTTNGGRVLILDGDRVGAQTVGAPSAGGFTITQIFGADGDRLGTAVANNATAVGAPDVDNDGVEDLVVSTGFGVNQVDVLVWFGGDIPVGVSSPASSASHLIQMPTRFGAFEPTNGDSPIELIWAGDLNGDGLEDLLLTDFTASETGERDGLANILWDDGI